MTATPIPIVAYVASPLHVLSALAAIKTFHPSEPIRVTLVVNYPTVGADVLDELYGIAKVMTEGLPLVDACVAVSNETVGPLAGRIDVEAAAKEFRALTGFGDVSEIYYFHDVMGVFAPMLAQAYPNARRICFGDCLGIAYERQYHLSTLGVEVPKSIATRDPALGKPSWWERICTTVTGARPPEFGDLSKLPFGQCSTLPHAAALILPIDESGGFVADIPRPPVAKALVLSILNDLIARCHAFRDYESSLLAGREQADKFVLLMECNAEGEFLTFEREVEMYCAIIEQYCPPGSAVFLKPHPAERFPRCDAIRSKFGNRYELIEFDARFKRYPIEFANRLVRNSTTISTSYPSLSLTYLYDATVIQPMDDAYIETWYSPHLWDFLRHSNSMMNGPRERLPNWDGQSLLWSGKR